MSSLADDLAAQIALKQQRKDREAAEERRHEARLEAEAASYDPWGKAGGGAPLRDSNDEVVGNLQVRRSRQRQRGLLPGHGQCAEQGGAEGRSTSLHTNITSGSNLLASPSVSRPP